MTSKVKEQMMSRVSARATVTGDDGVGSRRRLRAKSEAFTRRQNARQKLFQFPDPLEMDLSPLKIYDNVTGSVLNSEDSADRELIKIRGVSQANFLGMSLRSEKVQSPETPSKERTTRCRRRLWEQEPAKSPQKKAANDAGGEDTNPTTENDDGKPTSTSEVLDAENEDDLELRLELSEDDKNANPKDPIIIEKEEMTIKIHEQEPLVPLQVWKVGSSRLSLHGKADDSIDAIENETISRYYTQKMGTPEEQGPAAGDGDESEEDIDFVPDIPLDLSKSEDASPINLSPEALTRRAERDHSHMTSAKFFDFMDPLATVTITQFIST